MCLHLSYDLCLPEVPAVFIYVAFLHRLSCEPATVYRYSVAIYIIRCFGSQPYNCALHIFRCPPAACRNPVRSGGRSGSENGKGLYQCAGGLGRPPHGPVVPLRAAGGVVVAQQGPRLALDHLAAGGRQGGRAGPEALEQRGGLAGIPPEHGADLQPHRHVAGGRVAQQGHSLAAGPLPGAGDIHGRRDVPPAPKAEYVGGVVVPQLASQADVHLFLSFQHGLQGGQILCRQELLAQSAGGTAEAVIEMLDYAGIDLTGKRVTVVGRSLVIGKPVAMMLMKKNATVTVCHTKTKDMAGTCRNAEVLVAAAGSAKMIKPDYVADDAVVIDVGIDAEERGTL